MNLFFFFPWPSLNPSTLQTPYQMSLNSFHLVANTEWRCYIYRVRRDSKSQQERELTLTIKSRSAMKIQRVQEKNKDYLHSQHSALTRDLQYTHKFVFIAKYMLDQYFTNNWNLLHTPLFAVQLSWLFKSACVPADTHELLLLLAPHARCPVSHWDAICADMGNHHQIWNATWVDTPKSNKVSG